MEKCIAYAISHKTTYRSQHHRYRDRSRSSESMGQNVAASAVPEEDGRVRPA